MCSKTLFSNCCKGNNGFIWLGCKFYSNSHTFSLHLFKATLQVFETRDLVVQLRQPRLRGLEVKFKVNGRATDGGTVGGSERTTRGQLATETFGVTFVNF